MKNVSLKLPVLLTLALLFPGQVHSQKDEVISSVPDRYRSISLTQNTTNRTLLNVGQIAMWIYSDGRSANSPSGSSGLYFPRGNDPATALVFNDQLLWGGQVFDGAEPVLRVGGGHYAVAHIPGAILSPGVPEDTSDPNVDRVWRIRRDFATAGLNQDVAEFNAIPASQVTPAQIDQVRNIYRQDWLDWPAERGAPFYDADGDGQYTPVLNSDGTPRLAPRNNEAFDPTRHADEPGIADADQVVWLVTNDLGPFNLSAPNLFSSPSIGLEQQITLFAFNRANELGQIVFKRFRLIYKGTTNTLNIARIDSFYLAQWSDPDVGAATDDLAGCDPGLDLGFVYNLNSIDPVYAQVGLPPPAAGYDIMAGPAVPDANNEGIFNFNPKPGIRNLPITSFTVFLPGDSYSEPGAGTSDAAEQWWNLLRGYLPRPPLTLITDPTTGEPTKFMFTGDPVTGTGWVDQRTGDRRFIMPTGPITMALGDTQDVIIATIAGLGSDRLSSVSVMKFVDRVANEFLDNLVFGQIEPPALSLQATGLDQKVILSWSDGRNPVGNGRGYFFEGYNIYQGESANGPWKRIATFDEVNNIDIIFDERFDPETGVVLNLPVQFGRDSGIQHFIEIREDVIKDDGLENGHPVYFAVTSYLYNPDTEPNALESPFQIVAVTPIGAVIGTDYSDVAVDRFAEQIAGTSDGRVFITVIDPAQVTGHNYQVAFVKDASTGETLWSLVDLDLGETILDNQMQTNDSLDISGSIADGMLVQVLTPALGFSNFEMVANGAGLLDPPEGAAADFRNFPSLRPTVAQQVGSGKWLFNAGGGANDGTYATFLSRSLRNDNFDRVIPDDWEMRFTARGSWAIRWFEDSFLLKVPFELWNIGNSTPDDPSDDYRCIPYFLSSALAGGLQTDPAGLTYQIDPNDHGVSGGSNDPYTPWIYWIIPNENLDGTPGEVGYNLYLSQIDTTIVGADGNIGFNGGHEAFARTVLVNWNGDDVSDGVVEPSTQLVPEEGSIVRITSNKPNQENDIFRFSTDAFMPFDIAKGDLNDDGSVDVADVVSLIDVILRVSEPTGEQQYAADFNNDLAVNVADVVAIVNDILSISQSGEGEVAAAGTVDINMPLQAQVFDGIMAVPVQVGSETPIHGLQITLSYDPSQLAPLALISGSDGLRVYHHAKDGKVTYVLTSLKSEALSVSSVPEFRFEVLADAKSTKAEIYIEEVTVAGKYGQLYTTKIGNAMASTTFVPATFALHPNFPNPFNPGTMLRFDLPSNSKVTVEIFNILGQRVRHLLNNGDLPAGQHNLRWDGRNDAGQALASGVYLVRMRAAKFVSSRKIMLLK